MKFNFNTVKDGMTKWGNRSNLYVDGFLPFAFRKISSLAEGIAMGGLLFWDSKGRRQYFIGDDARALMADGSVIFKRAEIYMGFKGGDGASALYTHTQTQGYTSGRLSWTSALMNERDNVGELWVMGIPTQASSGWGGDKLLCQVFWKSDFTPSNAIHNTLLDRVGDDPFDPKFPDFMGVGMGSDRNPFKKTTHRGSVVFPLAIPKTKNQLVSGQRQAIMDGIDKKVVKYVDRAIDWYLKTYKDKILYLPVVIQWDNRQTQSLNYTVMPYSSDQAIWATDFDEIDVSNSKDKIYRIKTPQAAELREFVVDINGYTSEGYETSGPYKGNGNIGVAYQAAPQNGVAAGQVRANSFWQVLCGFEGTAAAGLSGKTPIPFWHDELPHHPSSSSSILDVSRMVSPGRGRMAQASSIAGVEIQWAMRGVLPALAMNADSTKRDLGWSGEVTLAELFRVIKAPQMPSYSSKTDSEDPVQRRLDIVAVNKQQPKLGKMNKTWESFWDPVAELEGAIQLIFDEAYRIADAEN